jgi:hypothetical protein
VDLLALVADQLAQPLLVAEPRGAILLHHPLIEPQAGQARRMIDVHLVVIEVRVAREQQPAAVGVHGDPGVTERVPDQRHEQDLGR